MTPESFEDLAVRTLENPSDTTTRTELEAALDAHPAWRQTWQELQQLYDQTAEHFVAREAARSTEAPATTDVPIIPPERLAALTKTNLRSTPKRPWSTVAWAAIGLAAAFALIAAFNLRPTADPLNQPSALLARLDLESVPDSLQRALTQPWTETCAATAFAAQRSDTAAIQLRSPLLATTAGPVPVAWVRLAPPPTNAVNYTVILSQDGREIWRTTTTETSLETPPLPTDAVFDLRIQPDDGTPSIREEFLTVTAATESADPLLAIVTAATAKPARLGDAVLAWWNLPDAQRHRPDARRIGLWLASVARQPDLRDTALSVAP